MRIAFAVLALSLAAVPAAHAATTMQVSARGDTTCAAVSGAAYCWGYNASGQVGNGGVAPVLLPTRVQGLGSGVAAVVTGGYHSCAIVDGGVKCWGDNDYGQLGNNVGGDSSVPVQVVGLTSGVTSIAAGDLHTCAVVNGAVRCWGSGGYGQLGTGGSIFSSAVPVAVSAIGSGATSVSAGRFHTCAIVNGAARCWGRGESGELGDGLSSASALAPVSVSGYGSATASLSAGGYFTCGARTGAAHCWGFGGSGQLGNGGTSNASTPQPVTGLASNVTQVSAGGSLHACAVVGGGAQCWGYNNKGQLGNSAAAGGTDVPIAVVGLASGVASISAGGLHTCAVATGGVYCWGDNANGQLGTGDQNGAATPQLVIAAPPVATALSANPATIDFGGQSVNTTSPGVLVTITNNGLTPITFTDAAATADFGGGYDCTTLAAGASCSAALDFTPTAAGAISGYVIFTTTAGTLTIDLAGIGELSLVTHYYRSILRRAPDAGGKAFWLGEAARMQSIGANVNEAWFAMAQFFFFSAEYQGFNRDNTGFVTDLYVTFFNRAPDAGGLNFWVSQVNSGMPREVVLASFMFSAEFTAFTQAIFGNTAARAEVDTVTDFYRGLLARLPDPGGFTAWVSNFRTAQCQGAAAVNNMVEGISGSFANGAEYAGKNRTNSQYVGDLYNAFLRRGGDLGGVQYWINLLDTAALTRNQVRQQFIASGEFQGRVAAIVSAGCVI